MVEMSGQLDLASSTAAIQACAAVDHQHVVADLSGLVFMDSSGYGALASSMAILERRGGSLVLKNAVGAPMRLLELVERLGTVPGTADVPSESVARTHSW